MMAGQETPLNVLLVLTGWVKPHALDVRTQERCRRATRLWTLGGFDVIVVSGGRFVSGQRWSAAKMMADMLEDEGVPHDKILIEDRSVDTFENIAETMRLLWKTFPGKRFRLSAVTDQAHAPRVRCIFKYAHELPVEMYTTDTLPSPTEMVRDLGGVLWTRFIDPHGTGRLARFIRKRRLFAVSSI